MLEDTNSLDGAQMADITAFFADSPRQKLVLHSKTLFWKVFFIKLCIKILLSTQSEGYHTAGDRARTFTAQEVKRWGYIWFSSIPDKVFRNFRLFWIFPSYTQMQDDHMHHDGTSILTFCQQRLYTCKKPQFLFLCQNYLVDPQLASWGNSTIEACNKMHVSNTDTCIFCLKMAKQFHLIVL